MAIALNTAGITVSYAPETVAGTAPTTGWVTIPGVKSIPAFGDDVNALQSTPLSSDTHTYEEGLKDSGGAIALTVNLTPEFQTAWETCITAYGTAQASDLTLWFKYTIPGMSEEFMYPAEPIDLGFGGAEVDEILEAQALVIPSGDFEWA